MFISSSFRNNLLSSIRKVNGSHFAGCGVRGISHSSPLAFNLTPCLMSMPLKKKKRMDPAIIKTRIEKKVRKINKEIRQLEKLQKPLKPIEEILPPRVLEKEMALRKREVPERSDNDKQERFKLFKEWACLRLQESHFENGEIQERVLSQKTALEELKKESMELYLAAIKIDTNLIPFTYKGPSMTPPIKGYRSPDGEYLDKSINWVEKVRKL
ncbi:UNVERIFIED_CONTAM: hypothetical protein PYX00_007321 [Menopon gallinae]|uniref:Large ribosomal subunit protein mL40 n=1 Tax=Menopon gallinae TaxID=328185 RepID=A0AAW2HII4_9NEOP